MDSHLLRFNIKNQKYIIWDLETESLNLCFANRPWQCSMILCEGHNILEKYDLFPLWEDIKLSSDAARITRFDKLSYISKSSDSLKCLDIIDSYLYDKDVMNVGHNILGFDVYVHNIWRKALGKKSDFSYIDRSIDTNCLAKAYRLQEKPDISNKKAWQYRMNSFHEKGIKTSLSAMCKEFNIDYNANEAHDGMYDCIRNRDIFIKLINSVEI